MLSSFHSPHSLDIQWLLGNLMAQEELKGIGIYSKEVLRELNDRGGNFLDYRWTLWRFDCILDDALLVL